MDDKDKNELYWRRLVELNGDREILEEMERRLSIRLNKNWCKGCNDWKSKNHIHMKTSS